MAESIKFNDDKFLDASGIVKGSSLLSNILASSVYSDHNKLLVDDSIYRVQFVMINSAQAIVQIRFHWTDDNFYYLQATGSGTLEYGFVENGTQHIYWTK